MCLRPSRGGVESNEITLEGRRQVRKILKYIHMSLFSLRTLCHQLILNHLSVFFFFFRLILLENSRSTVAPLALLQDVLEPVITPMSKNCKWNVNVPQLTKDAGLIQDTYEGSQYGTIMLGTYKKSL